MTPRATPTRAWGKRQWVRLAMCVVGLVLVVASSWMVLTPQWTLRSNSHGITRKVFQWLHHNHFVIHNRQHHLEMLKEVKYTHGSRYFRLREGGITDLGESWARGVAEKLAETSNKEVGVVYRGLAAVAFTRRGTWGCTSTEWAGQVSVTPLDLLHEVMLPGQHKSPESVAGAVHAFWRVEHSLPRPRNVEALPTGGPFRTREVHLSGHLLNTATILGLAMFLCFSPFTIRDARRAWRFRGSTTCKSCGYDLRGLSGATPLCPECGTARTAHYSPSSPRATPGS
jgi:hypothetical protein